MRLNLYCIQVKIAIYTRQAIWLLRDAYMQGFRVILDMLSSTWAIFDQLSRGCMLHHLRRIFSASPI